MIRYIIGDLGFILVFQLENSKLGSLHKGMCYLVLLCVVKLKPCMSSRHSGDGKVSEARYVHGDLRLRNVVQ